MVVRPRWPGEDTTPSASRDDASDAAAYSSADEASQPWPGLLTYHCIAVQLGRISFVLSTFGSQQRLGSPENSGRLLWKAKGDHDYGVR